LDGVDDWSCGPRAGSVVCALGGVVCAPGCVVSDRGGSLPCVPDGCVLCEPGAWLLGGSLLCVAGWLDCGAGA
jgi:hypothetical protein